MHEVGNAEEDEISEEVEEEEEPEDLTCCGRATICSPSLRDIIVTEPIWICMDQTLTWSDLFWMATIAMLLLTGWAFLYFLLGEPMLPGERGFGFFILIVFSYLLGWSLTYIPGLKLPPVFGMLLAGIILRNTDFYDIHDELGLGITSKIRTFCLTFIMIRAGLQLTTTAIRKYTRFILILAIVPCTVEMLVIAGCCYCVLRFPWDWSLMTGTIVGCMSPVVTINSMLALAEQGYGEDKGLATILCMAAPIDNVHIAWLFSLWYSFVFENDERSTTLLHWWSYLPGGFRDLLLGILSGTVLGLCLVFFPHRNHKYATWHRIFGLVLGALMCTSAASRLAVTGGGYLATLIMSFIAITGWRVLTASFDTTPLRKTAYILWHLVQPVLLGVIGADIDIRDWTASRFGLHLACIMIGLSARTASALLTKFATPFTWKEGLFVAIASLPKGTLQAALAPMAFEQARKEDDPEKIELALDVLRLSVIAIIFLAPLGTIAVTTTGPLLLNRITVEQSRRERRLSYLQIVSLQPVRTRKKRVSVVDQPSEPAADQQ